MPFIRALGYDIFDPTEVIPEFTADHGVKKEEKVDYAIVKDGNPVILFECKSANTSIDHAHLSQLYRYFSVTTARIGVLTNGTTYYFYSDLEEPNKMDSRPFLELDLLYLNDKLLPELKKLTKQQFDQDTLTQTAEELKYTKEIKKVLLQQLSDPSEEIVEALARNVYSGKMTQKAKEYFYGIVKDSFREFINDRVTQRLESAISETAANGRSESKAESSSYSEGSEEAEAEVPDIVTTEEEMEGFRIVRAILRQDIGYQRIDYKDYKSFFNVLLDGNTRKPLCRFYFNTRNKYLELFDAGKDASEKIQIEGPDSVYAYADRIRATPAIYE